jgi:hypothetical protein
MSKFDEAWASSTRNLSVALHRFIVVDLRRALSAGPRASRSEYYSGSRRLARTLCWKRVRATAGHNVFTPTLTGLGERSHLVFDDLVPGPQL